MLLADEFETKTSYVLVFLSPSLNLYWNANRYCLECIIGNADVDIINCLSCSVTSKRNGGYI